MTELEKMVMAHKATQTTIIYDGKEYSADLEHTQSFISTIYDTGRQHGYKKAAFAKLSPELKAGVPVITGIDDDDNEHGYDVSGFACVRVGEAKKGGEIEIFAVKNNEYAARRIGTAQIK